MKRQCLFRPMISSFVDGELSERKAERFRIHLEQCEDCRDQLQSLRTINDLMVELPEIQPSQDFDRIFWQKSTTQDDEKMDKKLLIRRLDIGWYKSAAVAGLALFIMAYFFLFRSPFPPSNQDIHIAVNFEFFSDFEVLSRIDLLENMDAIMELKKHNNALL